MEISFNLNAMYLLNWVLYGIERMWSIPLTDLQFERRYSSLNNMYGFILFLNTVKVSLLEMSTYTVDMFLSEWTEYW